MNSLRWGFFLSSLPGTEVKCHPVDKLCKNVSGGNLTKASILSAACRIRLRWSINTVCTGCTCMLFVHRVGHVCQLEGGKGVKYTSGWRIHLPCWEPISSCSSCSRKLIMMILNDEAGLNNDSQPKPLNTAPRPRTNRPFASYENTQ